MPAMQRAASDEGVGSDHIAGQREASGSGAGSESVSGAAAGAGATSLPNAAAAILSRENLARQRLPPPVPAEDAFIARTLRPGNALRMVCSSDPSLICAIHNGPEWDSTGFSVARGREGCRTVPLAREGKVTKS